MTDRERYHLHGPVHTLRIEFASIDPRTNDWAPPRQVPVFTFDRHGRQEGRVRDNDIVLTTFDERGLRTTVSSRGPAVRRQPGLEYGLGVDSDQSYDFLTRYDAHDRPVEILLRNAEQKCVYRTLLSYDDQDRLVREEVRHGDALTNCSGTASPEPAGGHPPTEEELAASKAAIAALLRDRVFSAREYVYDTRGRVAQLRERMSELSEATRTFAYDEHDNVIEDHYQGVFRDGHYDDDGTLTTSNEQAQESWSRYEYRYDEQGNWIEKMSFRREVPDQNFHRSSVERRTIAYFDDPLHTSSSARDQA
jgi:YD repeat-containing protein